MSAGSHSSRPINSAKDSGNFKGKSGAQNLIRATWKIKKIMKIQIKSENLDIYKIEKPDEI